MCTSSNITPRASPLSWLLGRDWGRCVSSRVRRWRYRHPLPSELDVRVAPHPAQAFANAPRGTRPLWSVVLARGSADDSWHVTTPCCPSCPNRLGCARCDDGSGSPPLRSAGVDHRPDIVPLVPSRDVRSGCDLPAFGSVANPTVPPGTVPTPDRGDSRRCGSSHSE